MSQAFDDKKLIVLSRVNREYTVYKSVMTLRATRIVSIDRRASAYLTKLL